MKECEKYKERIWGQEGGVGIDLVTSWHSCQEIFWTFLAKALKRKMVAKFADASWTCLENKETNHSIIFSALQLKPSIDRSESRRETLDNSLTRI